MLVNGRSPEASLRLAGAFRKGLNEAGYVEGQNVTGSTTGSHEGWQAIVSAAEATLRDIPEPARAIGLQIQVLNASTSREIEAAFATLVREQAEALFVAPDGFFVSRRVQFATLATRYGIPTAHAAREAIEAGALRGRRVSCRVLAQYAA
jgi:hypothetical protein